MTVAKVNRALRRGRDRALEHEDRYASAAEAALDQMGRRAARRFRERAQNHLALTSAAPDLTSGSTMVAVYPTPEQAVVIAQPNGEEAEVLHVTLAFLGDVDLDIAENASSVIREVASGLEPVYGTIGGTAAFGNKLADLYRIAEQVRPDGGYGDTAWNEAERTVLWVPADWTSNDEVYAAAAAFARVNEVERVLIAESESALPDDPAWTRVWPGERPLYPSIALPDVPGLAEVRQAVCEALRAAGIEYAESHGWTPHMTIAYTDELKMPPSTLLGLPLTFDRLTVARGNEPRDYRLGLPLTAAGRPPNWTPPHPDEILNVDEVIRSLRGKTDPVRLAAIKDLLDEAFRQQGLSFDVTNPFVGRALEPTGAKVVEIAETTRLNVLRIIRESYEEGLSIPDTATAIREGMAAAGSVRSRAIARTELAQVTNAGTLAGGQILGDVLGQPLYKRWLTAPGAEFPRHEDYEGLDGQTRELDEPFDVGGSELDYPADPGGPPEEVINCRCTLAMVESPDAPAQDSDLNRATIIPNPPLTADPVETADVDVAQKALLEGRRVVLEHPDEVSTLIEELGQAADAAEKAGSKARSIDLGKVTVRGTNLFTHDSLGLPRIEMPQLKGVPIPGSKADLLPRDKRGEVDVAQLFYQHLRDSGVDITGEDALVSHLRATQVELDGTKVAGIMRYLDKGGVIEGVVPVSRDGYIVDGHHRWAAEIGRDFRNPPVGRVDRGLTMKVERIDQDVVTILREANEFAAEWGLPQKGIEAKFGEAAQAVTGQKYGVVRAPMREPGATLTPEEALRAYGNSGYAAVNEVLRGDTSRYTLKTPATADGRATVGDVIARMDETLADSLLPEIVAPTVDTAGNLLVNLAERIEMRGGVAPTATAMRDALKMMDEEVRLPNYADHVLARPVRSPQIMGQEVEAFFHPGTMEIEIRQPRAADKTDVQAHPPPYESFVHEFGHYLDWQLGKTPSREGYATKLNLPALRPLREAINDSATTRRVQDAKMGAPWDARMISLEGFPFYRENLDYVLNHTEQFARAYTQWLSLRDAKLRKLFEATRADKSLHARGWYWGDKEFEPIADAFDDLFKAQGWKVPDPEEGYTYWRGVRNVEDVYGAPPAELVGKSFQESGYISTTSDRATAAKFAVPTPDSKAAGAIIRLRVPPGVGAAIRGETFEQEAILERGLTIKFDRYIPPGRSLTFTPTGAVPAPGVLEAHVELPKTAPAGEGEPFRYQADIGITPFRAGEDDPLGFYAAEKFQRFENDLKRSADQFGVVLDARERVTGIWQGETEPSLSLHVHDGEEAVKALVSDLGRSYNQDGVLVFDARGTDDVLATFDKALEQEQVFAAMRAAGIEGGRFTVDGRLQVIGSGKEFVQRLDQLSERLGSRYAADVGRFQLLERDAGDYEKAIRNFAGARGEQARVRGPLGEPRDPGVAPVGQVLRVGEERPPPAVEITPSSPPVTQAVAQNEAALSVAQPALDRITELGGTISRAPTINRDATAADLRDYAETHPLVPAAEVADSFLPTFEVEAEEAELRREFLNVVKDLAIAEELIFHEFQLGEGVGVRILLRRGAGKVGFAIDFNEERIATVSDIRRAATRVAGQKQQQAEQQQIAADLISPAEAQQITRKMRQNQRLSPFALAAVLDEEPQRELAAYVAIPRSSADDRIGGLLRFVRDSAGALILERATANGWAEVREIDQKVMRLIAIGRHVARAVAATIYERLRFG